MRSTNNKTNKKQTSLSSHKRPKVDSTLKSVNNSRDKSFNKKINIKLKWSLRFFKNLFIGANLYQRLYLIGWLVGFNVIILLLVHYILLLVLHQYFLSFYYKVLINHINTIVVLKYIFILNGFNFILGLVIEAYFTWKKDSKLLNITLSIMGAISSFISFYFARWIIVSITGLEPATFSRGLIVFSIPITVIFWLCLSVLVLSLIYYLILLLQLLSLVFPFNMFFSNLYIVKKRKKIKFNIDNKTIKAWIELFIMKGGTAIGAGLLSAIFFLIIIYFPSMIDWNNLNKIAENIIVYSDYRPENKVSECTNLEEGDWGLLIGYNKISVAKPEKLGGYIFTTKLCLFEDSTANKR